MPARTVRAGMLCAQCVQFGKPAVVVDRDVAYGLLMLQIQVVGQAHAAEADAFGGVELLRHRGMAVG